jgi:hypothetical protein
VRQWLAEQWLRGLIIYASAYGGDAVRWLTGFSPAI